MELNSSMTECQMSTKKKTAGNRTTSYSSLLGVVGMMYAKTKEQFSYYYQLATSDKGGDSVWYYLEGRKKKAEEAVQVAAVAEKFVQTMDGMKDD